MHLHTVQDWEMGAKYPSGERLKALLWALLETHGLTRLTAAAP
jgi:DNA-binding transcriptional regulator YiaG